MRARKRSERRAVTESNVGDDILLDDLASEEVVLDHTLEHFWRTMAIPDTFGVDDRDGALGKADSQTVGFGPLNHSAVGQSKFAKPLLEKLPGSEGRVAFAALGFGLVTAQKDMPSGPRYSQLVGGAPLLEHARVGIVGGRSSHVRRMRNLGVDGFTQFIGELLILRVIDSVSLRFATAIFQMSQMSQIF